MRAMAKRAKKLREQQQQQQPQSSQQQQQAERKKGKEYRPRMQRKASNDSDDFPAKQHSNLDEKNNSRNLDSNHENGFVEIREAKVSSTSMSNTTSVQSTLSHSKMSTNESIGLSNFVETSPTKITPSETSWLNSTSFEAASKLATFDESAASVVSTKWTPNEATSNYSEEQVELSQFEELEKALGVVGDDEEKGYRYVVLSKSHQIYIWFLIVIANASRVCLGCRLTKRDDYLEPILTIFEARIIFRGSLGSSDNWLEPKTKPP